jgi:hypothetical protein
MPPFTRGGAVHSKFDDPLELSDDCRTIFATGELNWEPGDAPQCKVTVKITQDGNVGHGDTGNYGHNKSVWWCQVKRDDGKKWDPDDQVLCHGEFEMSGPPPAKFWPDQTVTLTLQTAAAPTR